MRKIGLFGAAAGPLAAASMFLGCATSRPPSVLDRPMAVPADGLPQALSDDGSLTSSLATGGPTSVYVMDGWVESIDGRSVLIHSELLGGRQLRVTRHTEITVDGEAATLAELREGMPVRAAYSPTGQAKGLQAGAGAFDDEPPRR